MELRTYQDKVVALLKPEIANGNFMEKIGYLIGKLDSEVGECFGGYCKKRFHNKNLDDTYFIDEFGDITWYLFNLVEVLDKDFQQTLYDLIIETNKNEASCTEDSIMVSFMSLSKICGQFADYWIVGSFAADNIKCQSTLSSLLANLCHCLITIIKEHKFSLEVILNRNIEKLYVRHGEKYDAKFYTESPLSV
jgi:NTP pyrophosphatase (non-canonical NTP hydrolase)